MNQTAAPSLWRILRDNHWLLAVVSYLPPLTLLLFIGIFQSGVPRDLPFAYVDLDNSQASRDFRSALSASPALLLAASPASLTQGKQLLQRGDVLALVVVPKGFSSDMLLGASPEVMAYYNAQFLLSGKLISSSLTQAGMEYAALQSAKLRLARGQPLPEALMSIDPVRPQLTALYNPSLSYSRFLVTALGPAVWQILILIGTLMVIKEWLGRVPQPAPLSSCASQVLGLLLPLGLIMLGHGILMLLFFHHFLGWTSNGNPVWLLTGLVLMVLAVQSMSLLIMALSMDYLRALSLCAAYLAPAFAFMGVTFPRTDMNSLARIWGDLMPSTHYMHLQISVADHGASWVGISQDVGALAVFLVALPIGLFALARLPREDLR